MRTIDYIILHCTATQEHKDFDKSDIDRWHKARGFSGVGYHYVIKLNGICEIGRMENQIGAHAQGYNSNSIGVVYVGGLDMKSRAKDTRTPEQSKRLEELVKELLKRYPNAKVAGHYEFANKACPCFKVAEWCKSIGVAQANIY
jgi:N-acetylmuramoyl-L-alanine amidase